MVLEQLLRGVVTHLGTDDPHVIQARRHPIATSGPRRPGADPGSGPVSGDGTHPQREAKAGLRAAFSSIRRDTTPSLVSVLPQMTVPQSFSWSIPISPGAERPHLRSGAMPIRPTFGTAVPDHDVEADSSNPNAKQKCDATDNPAA
jgi:hypothetical protein